MAKRGEAGKADSGRRVSGSPSRAKGPPAAAPEDEKLESSATEDPGELPPATAEEGDDAGPTLAEAGAAEPIERKAEMTDEPIGIPLPGSERHLLPQARVIADAAPDEPLSVTVYVKPRQAEMSDEALMQANFLPPQQRSYLSPDQVEELSGAEPEDLARVARWAVAQGLEVGETSVVKRSIALHGDAETVAKAFGTQLAEYEHPTGRYRGRTGPVLVPEDLADVIEGVFGLDNRRMGQPYFRRALRPLLARAARPMSAYLAPQVASVYNFPPGYHGAGQTIGILAFNGKLGSTGLTAAGGYDPGALQAYFSALGLTMPEIVDVVVHGPGNQPGNGTDPTDVTGEVLLDIQVAGACAPGAKLVIYFTEFTERGWVDAIMAAVTDTHNNPTVLSISYGNPEDAELVSLWSRSAIDQVNNAFRTAALRGITICCASGDDGARDQVADGLAHADFPASSPWVLGCGGTRLDMSSGTLWETVWNGGPGSAGGGGVSRLFPVPPYQRSMLLPASVNPGQGYGRVIPDVSGNADPETGFMIVGPSGQFEGPIGGTSATAPLWAALIAILNQAIGKPIGFFNPILYQYLSTGVLRDILVGNNGAYSAAVGYDACTGLGSPDGGRLLMALLALGSGPGSAASAYPPGQPTSTATKPGAWPPGVTAEPARAPDNPEADIARRLALIEASLAVAAAERQQILAWLSAQLSNLRARGLA